MNSNWCNAGELINYSVGGGWGKEKTDSDYVCKVAVIRGADFPSIDKGEYHGLPIRWEKLQKAMNASLQEGDIVIEISGGTESRPTGRTILITKELLEAYDCPIIPASFCRLIRSKDTVNSVYFYYWLQEMYRAGRTWGYQNRSTGLSNFQYKTFCNMESVFIPEVDIQRKIASILLAFDKKRRVLTQLNDYLAETADSLFINTFGHLEENAVLSDIANITMGQSPMGASYNNVGNGVIFYQGRGEFGWRFPTRRLFTTEPKRMAKAGDILMSVRAPVGDLNIAYEDCCIGRGLAAINCSYPSFCLYLMRSLCKKLSAYNSEGTVFGSINSKDLKNIEIALPNVEDIIGFEDKVVPIDNLIKFNEIENRNLSQLRDMLLSKLMSS